MRSGGVVKLFMCWSNFQQSFTRITDYLFNWCKVTAMLLVHHVQRSISISTHRTLVNSAPSVFFIALLHHKSLISLNVYWCSWKRQYFLKISLQRERTIRSCIPICSFLSFICLHFHLVGVDSFKPPCGELFVPWLKRMLHLMFLSTHDMIIRLQYKQDSLITKVTSILWPIGYILVTV